MGTSHSSADCDPTLGAFVPTYGRNGCAGLGAGVGSGCQLPEWGPFGGVTPAKILKFQTQIPAFWRTFSQTINSCKSAKYHTFPFQAVLHAPSME